jgi:hypothetical protein
MYDIDGDSEADQQKLTDLLRHFRDAYLDFDIEPHIDEVAEMSAWTRSVFEFGTRLEAEYGFKTTKAMFSRSWQEAGGE